MEDPPFNPEEYAAYLIVSSLLYGVGFYFLVWATKGAGHLSRAWTLKGIWK